MRNRFISTANQTPDPSCPPNSPGKWTVFFFVAIGVFMSTLDSSIVNIALPSIMADLHVPLHVIEWVPMIYLLTISSLLLTFGRVSDLRGRHLVYGFGFVIFSMGSLFCALAIGASHLILARAFQGVGASMLMACSPALVVDAFPESERGKALGTVGMVVALGLTTGPAVGGFILEHFSWRVLFFINVPIGIGVTLLAFKVLNRMPFTPVKEPLDWAGSILLAICFGSFIVGLSHFHDWGPTSSRIIASFSLFILSGLVLFQVERKSSHPIFPPWLLSIRLFALSISAAVILFIGMFFVTFLMPFFMVHPLGFSMNKVGITMMIPSAFQFLVAPISGALSDRMGSRTLCTLGMTLITIALICLAYLGPGATMLDIDWRLALVGIGVAIFISPNSASAMSSIEFRYRGIASGSVASARNLGMVIGVAVAGLMFNYTFRQLNGGTDFVTYRPALQIPFLTAFHRAMMTGAVITGFGIIIAYLRGRDSGRRQQHHS